MCTGVYVRVYVQLIHNRLNGALDASGLVPVLRSNDWGCCLFLGQNFSSR